ncbi:MAG: tRNA dihydrouridine synthase DusB [Ruminococcaceae bacterium]|nr:tRNA dihydrouridine synthase DusB [Oscillospiraceae bacterium]
MRIGSFELKNGLFLAPLAGVSDRSFRDICRKRGAEYTVSEMISAKAMCYDMMRKKPTAEASATLELATVYKYEMPIAIQLFGREPEFMARAAQMIEECSYRGCVSDTRPAAIDINMGCPVKKIVSNGEGSALMREPILAAEIVRAVKSAVSLPVTVKIRAGFDSECAPEFAKRLEDAGADLITVHARTREQMYLPGVDISVIARTKAAVSVPVIGNGDIYTASDAIRMMSETGCDGVMIARGALGNPWIFSEIASAMSGESYTPPSTYERLEQAKAHLLAMLEDKPQRRAIAEAKKHIAWYIKGMNGAAAARSRVMCAESPSEIEAIINELQLEVSE